MAVAAIILGLLLLGVVIGLMLTTDPAPMCPDLFDEDE